MTAYALLIILLLLIFFLLGLAAGRWIGSGRNAGFKGGVELSARPLQSAVPQEDTPEQGVVIPGKGSLYIPAGETRVRADFYNPAENKGLYYLTFELRLPGEEGYETLYSSGLVEPETGVEEITLSRPLDKGEYTAVIRVQPYHMDKERTPTNNADIVTKLVVS